MTRHNKLLCLKFAVILSIIPIAIKAYETGPDPRYTGAPGDNKTACLAGGCHVGTLNASVGSVKIILPGGTTYSPGVKQHIQVQITDSSKQKFGFQLTARLASNLQNGQAGDFSTTDSLTQVLCDDGSTKSNGKACSSTFPVEFIEHTFAGYTASTSGGYTYSFDWTPPATNVGNVTLYAAGNAGPGGAPVSTGADVYTTNVTLTPVAAASGPAITSVQNGTTFQSTALAPNMYATIKGTGLSTGNSRIWAGTDFTGSGTKPPTAMDTVSVTVNGTAAYIYYISPTQINFITPATSASGNGIQVVATVNGIASSPASVTMQAVSPSLFSYQPGTSDDLKYAIAVHGANNALIGKSGLFPSAPTATTPAARGELITLYGTGFGPTSPAVPAGVLTDSATLYEVLPSPIVTVGGVPATARVFLVATLFQFYQVNLTLPANVPTGDQPIVLTVNGTPSASQLITIQ